MDLILGPYADGALSGLDDGALDDYEALLEQADPDLYAWVCGSGEPDARLRPAVERVRRFHRIG
jgi:succinate dehydrogenase flavin-adding protein (antitoxin of CptAB toxin-antitoxin module)